MKLQIGLIMLIWSINSSAMVHSSLSDYRAADKTAVLPATSQIREGSRLQGFSQDIDGTQLLAHHGEYREQHRYRDKRQQRHKANRHYRQERYYGPQNRHRHWQGNRHYYRPYGHRHGWHGIRWHYPYGRHQHLHGVWCDFHHGKLWRYPLGHDASLIIRFD